jgi:hypothetical protein
MFGPLPLLETIFCKKTSVPRKTIILGINDKKCMILSIKFNFHHYNFLQGKQQLGIWP